MKRFISLLIAILILFTTASAEKQAFYTDVSRDNPCYKHVLRLSGFGLISGFDDNTFRPNTLITRAEAAKLACASINAMGVYPYDLYFNDISTEHWAYHYISRLFGLKMVSGYDDNYFRPENKVTYNEFLRMFVPLAGYEPYAHEQGGYPDGYVKTASDLGITDGLTFSGDDYITRQNASIIMDRLLDVPLYTKGYIIDGDEYKQGYSPRDGVGKDYLTILIRYHNIYTVTGTVSKSDTTVSPSSTEAQKEDVYFPDYMYRSMRENVSETDFTKMDYLDKIQYLELIRWLDFQDNNNVSRGDFAKVVSRLAGRGTIEKKQSAPDDPPIFYDIQKSSLIYDAVDIMAKSGYMTGFYENEKYMFKPNELISEEECVDIMLKMLNDDCKKTELGKYQYDDTIFTASDLKRYIGAMVDIAGITEFN